MAIVEEIEPAAWRSAPWGDAQGTSHEIARWSDGGDGYLARVSIATIERGGRFTPTPGYRRHTEVLDDGGGLRLSIEGTSQRAPAGASFDYDGAAAVAATVVGPARVWNLIARADVGFTVRRIAASREATAWPAGVVVVTAADGLGLALDGAPFGLGPLSTLIATSSVPIQLRADGPAVVAHLALAPQTDRGRTLIAAPAQRVVELDGAAMTLPAALHAELARRLGLPASYGHNLDALIDVLSSLDEPDATAAVTIAPGGVVVLVVDDAAAMPAEVYAALSDAVAVANLRRHELGLPAIVTLAAAR